MSLIDARGLRKHYRGMRAGDVCALDGFDLTLEPGRILGLIGPNGSGKTTALKAFLGLTHLDGGDMRVLGLDPRRQRKALMTRTGYIADVGTLPRWMRVHQLLDYVAGVHPGFRRERAQAALSHTDVRPDSRIQGLSRGMTVQLHLALVLAVQADLLVLDEPTLGLDILYRQQFYDRLLSEFDGERQGILITTHEVREIEHLLTDVVFIHHGRAVLQAPMDDLAARFLRLGVGPGEAAAARALGPISERHSLNGIEMVFDGRARSELEPLGPVATPTLPELFVALLGENR
ncbi:MAG: ABC transporter ATP-binding protein [Pseudomonadales bacterium]